MELLEAVKLSIYGKKIAWKKVRELMLPEERTPQEWLSEWRRINGDSAHRKSIYDYWPTSGPIPPNAPIEPTEPAGGRVSVEMRSDGTTISERRILMSETDMKNPKFVLSAHGFDPAQFELVNAVNNFWVTKTGEDKDLCNFQSKITVKPIASKGITLDDLKDVAKNFTYTHERITLVRTEGKYAIEVDLADLHISSMSWGRESGEDNDSKITVQNIKEIVAEIKEVIKLYPIEKVYIIFLGDILQVDTETGTTTGGTQVNQDGRPSKMIETAYELLIHIIAELAIVPTEVIAVQGNHSRMVEYAIMYSLHFIFRDNPHITFNITPRLRTCFVYGTNLIGLMHGDMPKKKWFEWLHVEYRTEWGITKRAEIHAGHLHNEMTEGQKSGQMLRFQRSPKPIDGWEYKEGFVGSEKGVMAYLWDAEKGIKQTFYF